jgi:thiamine-monophosphate kinase
VREGELLASAGITSMMDISDGLVLSLYDLLDANECGYAIDSARLPLLEGVSPEKSREYALFGGGDFHLLFTCPPEHFPVPGLDCFKIGTVISEHTVLVDDETVPLRGYQHQWK